MKLTVLLLSLFLSISALANDGAAVRPNPGSFLKLIAKLPGVKQLGVYSIISHRCRRYLSAKPERRACESAVEKKVLLLDFDFNDSYFVAFKKNLITLMSLPKTSEYLNKVQEELNRPLTSEKPIPTNLWQLTLNFYGDQFIAAKVLATLFQDTSQDRAHLLYLDKADLPKSKTFDENRMLLAQVIESMEMLGNYAGDQFQPIFYPSEIKQELSRAIYHFYVPLYLSMALRKNGTEARFAHMAPTMMSLTYEFMSFTNPDSFEEFYQDPANIDASTSEGANSIRDIMTGASGARFGVGLLEKLTRMEEIAKAFKQSSAAGVGSLLR